MFQGQQKGKGEEGGWGRGYISENIFQNDVIEFEFRHDIRNIHKSCQQIVLLKRLHVSQTVGIRGWAGIPLGHRTSHHVLLHTGLTALIFKGTPPPAKNNTLPTQAPPTPRPTQAPLSH